MILCVKVFVNTKKVKKKLHVPLFYKVGGP